MLCVLVLRQGLGGFLSPSCPEAAEPFPCPGMSFCPPALLGAQESPQDCQRFVVKGTQKHRVG